MKRNRLLHNQTDSDPMGTVANLFDGDNNYMGSKGEEYPFIN